MTTRINSGNELWEEDEGDDANNPKNLACSHILNSRYIRKTLELGSHFGEQQIDVFENR